MKITAGIKERISEVVGKIIKGISRGIPGGLSECIPEQIPRESLKHFLEIFVKNLCCVRSSGTSRIYTKILCKGKKEKSDFRHFFA